MALASFRRATAAAELDEDVPGLELGVRARRVRGVSRGRGWPLSAVQASSCPCTGSQPRYCRYPLSARVTRPAFSSSLSTPQIHRLLVVDRARQRAGDPTGSAHRGLAKTCGLIPCFPVLARVEGPVRGNQVDRDWRAAEDDIGVTCPFASRTALWSFGVRAASSSTVSFTYRQAVIPADPKPSRELGERLALAQVCQHGQGLRSDWLATATRLQGADNPGRVVQRPGRQRQRGTVEEKSTEAPSSRSQADLGRLAHLPGASSCPAATCRTYTRP